MELIVEQFQVMPIALNGSAEMRAAFVSFVCNGFWLSGIKIENYHGSCEIKYPTQGVCGGKASVFMPFKKSMQAALEKKIINEYKVYCERINDTPR